MARDTHELRIWKLQRASLLAHTAWLVIGNRELGYVEVKKLRYSPGCQESVTKANKFGVRMPSFVSRAGYCGRPNVWANGFFFYNFFYEIGGNKTLKRKTTN